jgi:hypothetical protein
MVNTVRSIAAWRRNRRRSVADRRRQRGAATVLAQVATRLRIAAKSVA